MEYIWNTQESCGIIYTIIYIIYINLWSNHMESSTMVIYSDAVRDKCRLCVWINDIRWQLQFGLRILQLHPTPANLRQVTKVCCLFWSCLQILQIHEIHDDVFMMFSMIFDEHCFPEIPKMFRRCVGKLSNVLDFGHFLPILHNLSDLGHGRPRIRPVLRSRLHCLHMFTHVYTWTATWITSIIWAFWTSFEKNHPLLS